MKRENKQKRTVPRFSIAAGLTWRLGILVGLLWLTAMGLLTVISARQLQDKWEEHASRMSYHPASEGEALLPGAIEYRYIKTMYSFDTLGRVFLELPLYKDPTHNRNPYKDPDISYETAMVFLEDGEPVLTNGDYTVFAYVHADSWAEGAQTPDGYAYIDLAATPLEGDTGTGTWSRIQSGFFYEEDIFRLTGYFEGNRFVLEELAGFSVEYPVLYEGKSLSQWDQERGLNWEIHYQNPEKPTRELISIYTTELENHCHMAERPLAKLMLGPKSTLKEALLDLWPQGNESRSLLETVIIEESNTVTSDGTHHKVLAAIRCRPLFSAMERLWPVYAVGELLCILLVVLYYFFLKRRIRDPLQQIIGRAQQNMLPLNFPYEPKWKEPYLLEQLYIKHQQELQTLRQENQQLKTALEYAKNAEANRRQMVSNITHELKTPLAVIHSYTEGLQAGIAPEKQEKYLQVITEEADRMDAMVLEMLDLSRLEAGKVRLSQDSVELLSLTEGILQKLEPLLRVKELKVTFAVAEQSTLTADEGRLGQVVTNLVSNAIKYSPQGGQICINVFQRNGFTHFTIENESKPLSAEALEKVWESFYRTEQSRTTKGTGLGLSICKAIIELHRGQCRVRNTSSGVEFGFVLP